MKIVECTGSHRKIGETIGEALRDEIRSHIARFVVPENEAQMRSIAYFAESTRKYIPQVFEQLEGTARGAGVAHDRILALNAPLGSASPFWDQGCSNIVFSSGPDGPIWGKNNEGNSADMEGRRPVCALKLYPDDGIPAICFTFCGWLSGGDMINAEGVCTGHSSAGSRFAQSPYNVSALHWLYAGMLTVRSSGDLARHLTSVPLRGKGFSMVAVDRSGDMFSGELVCPLVQIREPVAGVHGMNCVNHYQLPSLKGIDMRTPEQLAYSIGRQAYLENAIEQGDRSLAHMQSILRHHGEYSICRHRQSPDDAYTEYSMIGLPVAGRAYVLDGNPCQGSYTSISF